VRIELGAYCNQMVGGQDGWRSYWEAQSHRCESDFEFDRGTSPRTAEIERLSRCELLEFIGPESSDVILDAGCGSGANILLLHEKVKRVIGVDFSNGAVERCKRSLASEKIQNVQLIHGKITSLPVHSDSVDKVLCLSVLQYLGDDEVRKSLVEFARVLKPEGVVFLHVKNISSLYLATLWAVKKAKRVFNKGTKLERFRSYRWYVRELQSAGFKVTEYNSFNLFIIEGLPRRFVHLLQKLELKHYSKFPLRLGFIRRHGSDLKIKARVTKANPVRERDDLEDAPRPRSSI
jgi:ubiquinone/menaquinone biosynthesis C-methylase UbiE